MRERTNFELDMPEGYDIPLSFVFPNISTIANYRCQLYVNGYQFGKYGTSAPIVLSKPNSHYQCTISVPKLHSPSPKA